SQLPTKQQYDAADAGRITSGAAIALKARVLLYENRWAEVVTECEKLMSGQYGQYGLFSSYEGIFLPQNENNIEDILDVQYVPEVRTYADYFDLAPLSVGARDNAMAPLQELVNDYLMLNGKAITETGSGYDESHPYQDRDPRMTATIVYDGYAWKKPDGSTQTIYIKPGSDPDQSKKLDEYGPGRVSSPTGYYMRKYYDPQGGNNFLSGLNLILIRYADVLLMYAEAKNELGQMDADTWTKTISALRTRAGFTDPAALNFNAAWSKADLQTIIRRERRCELAMEGTRIFDLRRWKTAEKVLNGWAHGARFGDPSIDNGYIRVTQRTFNAQKHYLWPVPRDERALDPNLGQNPNW
ncbi:MAG TPA: RagB/SusD family nutrient uptake outer membrane protein, partial [Chitinophaga sp.]